MRICRIPRARCQRYVDDGMTLAQIAFAEGWSESTIQKHLAGLGIRHASRAVITQADIRSIITGRETARQVAARLGVTRNAVYMAGVRSGFRISQHRPQYDLFARAA